MNKYAKIPVALMMGAIVATTGIVNLTTPQTVYAVEQKATTGVTTKRSITKISVNDSADVEMTGFNIDGYNYYRVADIAKVLNVKINIMEHDGKQAVEFVSNMSFDGGILEAVPNIDTLKDMALKDYVIYFDEGYFVGKAFNYEGRNYVQIKSVVTASNENKSLLDEYVPSKAAKGIIDSNTFPVSLDLKTEYIADTNTIKISTTKTDYQQMFETAILTKQGKTVTQTKEIATEQPKLAQAPEVGTVPAKILKDVSKGAYVDGKVNKDNFTEPYQQGAIGQCTWYAKGRFIEVNKTPIRGDLYDLQGTANDYGLKVLTKPYEIAEQSIAVFGKQHVVFIEYVERDDKNMPLYIFYTDANLGVNGVYNPTEDGKVRKIEFNSFLTSVKDATYIGCITVK